MLGGKKRQQIVNLADIIFFCARMVTGWYNP